MSKKLRKDPIYIAPEILGSLNNDFEPVVIDERNGNNLDPRNVNDKIIIYDRQVKGWFLKPAKRYTKSEKNGFIVLMICLSYLEGIEQYIQGRSNNNNSKSFFRSSV